VSTGVAARDARRPSTGGEPASREFNRHHRLVALAVVVDVVMLIAATGVVALVSPTSSPTGHIPTEPLVWSLAFSVAILVTFGLRGMYGRRMRIDQLDEVLAVVSGVAVAAIAVMAARVVLTNVPYVAAETIRQAAPAIAFLAVGRSALLWREVYARRRGLGGFTTLIIGAGRVGHLVARRLLNEPELGLRPIGFVDGDPLGGDDESPRLPVLGAEAEFEAVMERYGVQHVIVAFSGASHDVLLPMVRRCWTLGVPVSLVPRLFEAEGVRVTTEHIGDMPLVGVHPSDPTGWQFRVKYAVDRAVSAVLLAAMLPLLAAIAIAVRVTSGPNVLYRQRRVGRDGRAFDMLKFRTMRDVGSEHGEADADWAAAQTSGVVPGSALSQQDRYTSLGRFLRRSALDELPQLWNVLRGDMSLVGPRPERLSYSTLFESDIYRYGDRHRVKSGLTGWAQVNGLRGKTSLADRIEWDNHYIENWSLWLDFKIVMRTMGVVFRGGGQA